MLNAAGGDKRDGPLRHLLKTLVDCLQNKAGDARCCPGTPSPDRRPRGGPLEGGRAGGDDNGGVRLGGTLAVTCPAEAHCENGTRLRLRGALRPGAVARRGVLPTAREGALASRPETGSHADQQPALCQREQPALCQREQPA
eukprot:TRINITY_DN4115_c0_g1_i5.p2 TRINITY_DN4115_c0_g1~~TRINITY_DN4115_c0_g1_i5.p2  ORF type:complete len:142 (+),score=7.02 TRINITY_DN4115_c0_g1_i5:694-1119(+)